MMMKKYIALFALVMMCNSALHPEIATDGVQLAGEPSGQVQASDGNIQKLKNWISSVLAPAQAAVNNPNLSPEAQGAAVKEAAAQIVVATAVSPIYQAEGAIFVQTVSQAVDVIKSDSKSQKDPVKRERALTLVLKGIRAVVVAPLAAVTGIAIAAPIVGAVGGVAGVGVGASMGAQHGFDFGYNNGRVFKDTGYKGGNIFKNAEGEYLSMAVAAKRLTNGLTRGLAGVISGTGLAALGAIGTGIAATGGGLGAGAALGGAGGYDIAMMNGGKNYMKVASHFDRIYKNRTAESGQSETELGQSEQSEKNENEVEKQKSKEIWDKFEAKQQRELAKAARRQAEADQKAANKPSKIKNGAELSVNRINAIRPASGAAKPFAAGHR